ncbi:MAG: tail fiber protein [Sulfurimonas sp.]|nr:tail fiber protein [Sulfurimonas sp.]
MNEYFYIGEIKAFPYANLLIEGWLPCGGTILPVNSYQALYAVIGRNFTDNSVSNSQFALPNINGRVPVSSGAAQSGSVYTFAKSNGSESAVLSNNNIAHAHTLTSSITGDLLVNSNKANSGDLATAVAFASKAAVGMSGNLALGTSSTNQLKGVAVNLPVSKAVPNATNVAGTQTPSAYSILEPFLAMHYYICAQDGVFPVRED